MVKRKPKGFGTTNISGGMSFIPRLIELTHQQPSQPFLRRNIYSSPHGVVVVPLAATNDSPEVLRISGDVQAVGYDHG